MAKQATAPPVQDAERAKLLDRIETLTDVNTRLREEVQLLAIVRRAAMAMLGGSTESGVTDLRAAIDAYNATRPAKGNEPVIVPTDVSTKADKISF